jgi:hypothetical protein
MHKRGHPPGAAGSERQVHAIPQVRPDQLGRRREAGVEPAKQPALKARVPAFSRTRSSPKRFAHPSREVRDAGAIGCVDKALVLLLGPRPRATPQATRYRIAPPGPIQTMRESVRLLQNVPAGCIHGRIGRSDIDTEKHRANTGHLSARASGGFVRSAGSWRARPTSVLVDQLLHLARSGPACRTRWRGLTQSRDQRA